MKIFYGILFTCVLLLSACGASPDDDDDDWMSKVIAAQTTDLITTANLLGSFSGSQLPNLQQDDLEPGEYTLHFQVVDDIVDNLGFAAYAYVTWKVKGQQVSRIVSVFNGQVISGVADSVHVNFLDQSGRLPTVFIAGTWGVTNGQAAVTSSVAHTLKQGQQVVFDNQPGVIYVFPNGMSGTNALLDRPFEGATNAAVHGYVTSPYKVAAILSRGTRPTIMQPPVLFTFPTNTSAPGSGPVVPFPPAEAGVISVMVNAAVTPVPASQTESIDCIVRFLNSAGTVIGEYVPNDFNGWFPIPPGSVNMIPFNGSTKNINFTVQWGIEG